MAVDDACGMATSGTASLPGRRPDELHAASADEREHRPSALRRHGLLIGCLGIFSGVVAVRLPKEIGQDTWLSLLVGRRIAHGGIPHHDSLTAWTLGQSWVDQQWLAHLFSYAVYVVGGMVLLALCQVLLVGGSVAAAVVFARARGASARTISWLLVVTIYPILLAAGGVRTQTFVLPLFVALLALLVVDARHPSRRVLAALPLLALYANLHGSAAIAAMLVVLRGALGVSEGKHRGRYATLAVGAVVALGATPYGVHIVTYYRSTLVNPAFRKIVTEWGAPTPNLRNAPIFVLIGLAIWLLARQTNVVGRFGLLAELALIVLTLTAVRSAVWFGLGSIMLLAPALDAELGGKELSLERLNRTVGLFGVAFATIMMAAVLSTGAAGLTDSSYPPAAAAAVARAAAAHPSRSVYSNERYADWLLFTHPELAGRVAFDARFEMLSPEQLQRIFIWTNQLTDEWRQTIAGAGVVVLDLPDEKPVQQSLVRRHGGLRQVYETGPIAVFARARP